MVDRVRKPQSRPTCFPYGLFGRVRVKTLEVKVKKEDTCRDVDV